MKKRTSKFNEESNMAQRLNKGSDMKRHDDIWISEVTGERVSEREIASQLHRYTRRLGCSIAFAAMFLTLVGASITMCVERTISKRVMAKQPSSAEQSITREQRPSQHMQGTPDIHPNATVDTPPLPAASLDEVSKVVKSSDGSFKDLSERLSDHGSMEYICFPKMTIRTSGSDNAISANNSRVIFDPDVEYYITFNYREGLTEDEDFYGDIRVEYPTFIPQGQIGFVQIVAYDGKQERYSLGEIEVFAKASDINLLHTAGVTSYFWSEYIETHWSDNDGGFGFSLYSSPEPTDVMADREDGISSVGGTVSYQITGNDSGNLVSTVTLSDDAEATVIELGDVRTVSELREDQPTDRFIGQPTDQSASALPQQYLLDKSLLLDAEAPVPSCGHPYVESDLPPR